MRTSGESQGGQLPQPETCFSAGALLLQSLFGGASGHDALLLLVVRTGSEGNRGRRFCSAWPRSPAVS